MEMFARRRPGSGYQIQHPGLAADTGDVKLFDRFRSARIASPSWPSPSVRSPARKPDTKNWVGPPAPHAIHHGWLQVPTFRAAGFLVDVVGESFHQEAIEAAAGGRHEDGAVVPLVIAQLVREPNNPYDANAVRVDIGDSPCGHIARAEAPRYHGALAALAEIGRPATCRAWITGGWDRGVLDKGHFGVKLDLHANLEWPERVPVLPFGEGRVSITGEEKSQDYLAVLLGGRERVEVIADLGDPCADRIGVRINGQAVGALTPKMSERYGPWVAETQAALLPATCEARVVQGPKKIEVFLKLSKPW